MDDIAGVGGVFLRAHDPKALAAWYRENLGVPLDEGQTYGMFVSASAGEQTVWSTFPEDTDYFGRREQGFMVNYRVRDLDAVLARLRTAGADVLDEIQEEDYGRFGWAVDPEGNRFELWEPPAAGA